jgi:hypothetical protein
MASGVLAGRPRGVAVVAIGALAVLALVVGCGTPQFTYVANSSEKTYFKVPSGWHKIDEVPIDNMFSQVNPDSATAAAIRTLTWSAAFDAASDPMPEHMTSSATNADPVLYVTVRHLTPAEQGSVSYDAMRDFFLPVTDARRSQAEQAGVGLEGFELLYDQVITGADGIHGVREVYNYQLPSGAVHTFDQTTYANADSSTIYFLLIRCSARCYRDRAVELNDVAKSFTVRSKA